MLLVPFRTALVPFAAALALAAPAAADDPVFSGPQVGEKLTAFRALAITGPDAGKEIDPAATADAPAVLVFLHGLERSMVPLTTVIDQYGAEKATRIKTRFVALAEDRTAAEQRLPLVARSLRLQAPLALSLDGAEGPGNYGLNKKCLMTVLLARGNQVTANFALVQPGIADAPKVLAELAKLAGDPQPPTAEELRARRGEAAGARPDRPNRPDNPNRPDSPNRPDRPDRPAAAPVDLSRLDLNSPEGLREAVRLLAAEVRSLREEVQRLRGPGRDPGRPDARPGGDQPDRRPDRRPGGDRPGAGADLPGAAPTDPKLISMLRSFIQPSNDPATVDRIVTEVEAYVKTDPALRKQAFDGWTRVLSLKYGTEYAQKAGQALVGRLKP